MAKKNTQPANPVKEKWARGEPTFGAWLSIPSTFSAEAVARRGFDWVCIDTQHGLIDFQMAAEMLLAVHAAGTVPFVRVPSNDFAAINRMLDAGALGIIVPMIASADDVRAMVNACRYPPAGARSFGPTRAALAMGGNYFDIANDAVACIPMIETKSAVEAIEEIVALPGVDGVYVGPNDLSLALGQGPGLDNDGDYAQAYQRIAKACAAAGVAAGIHASASLAAKHVTTGYGMITVASDLAALVRGVARDLRTAREG